MRQLSSREVQFVGVVGVIWVAVGVDVRGRVDDLGGELGAEHVLGKGGAYEQVVTCSAAGEVVAPTVRRLAQLCPGLVDELLDGSCRACEAGSRRIVQHLGLEPIAGGQTEGTQGGDVRVVRAGRAGTIS